MAFAALLGLMTGLEPGAWGQKASVPRVQNGPRLSRDEIKQLVVLMDMDRSGSISKLQWMRFMEEEFERLDKDRDGHLDPQDLVAFELQPGQRPFSSAGK